MKLRIALVAVAAASTAALSAQAAPVSGNTTASAEIVAPNRVTPTRALQFGSIARPVTGTSTVTVASSDSGAATPTITGGGDAFVPTSGQAFAASFRLNGTSGQTYSVTDNVLAFPTAGANLTGVGAEGPVVNTGALGTLPAGGEQTLYIGGHFDISPSTAINTYNGTLNITVNFN